MSALGVITVVGSLAFLALCALGSIWPAPAYIDVEDQT